MRFDSVNFLVLQRLNPSVISLLGRIHMGVASIFSDPGSIVICIDLGFEPNVCDLYARSSRSENGSPVELVHSSLKKCPPRGIFGIMC